MARSGVVADASVLIALAKLGRLTLLRDLYGVVRIGPAVYEEVVTQGRRLRAVGLEPVEQALRQGWLVVVALTKEESELVRELGSNDRLGPGEIEAISVAGRRKQRLLVDDKEARLMASSRGIEYVGTVGVMMDALRAKKLSPREFEEAIERLASILWLSPGVIVMALRFARERR